MIDRIIAKLFLNEFEKTLYKAALDGHLTAGTFFSRDYPDFGINVNGVHVKVEMGRIEINKFNSDYNLLPKSPILYSLLKRLYKKRQVEEKKRKAVEAYKAALDAIKGNDKK